MVYFAMNCVYFIHSFSRCTVEESEPMEAEKIEGKCWIEVLIIVKEIIVDCKIHLRKVFEVVCSGVQQTKEVSTDIGFVLNNQSCQESRIKDIDRAIKELHGKVDRIVEDIQKMVNMNECIHCEETLANGIHPME